MKILDAKERDRSTYIGSHDTAALAGHSPYLTPMQVYMNKVGLEQDLEGEHLQWGLALEGPIVDEYCARESISMVVESFALSEDYDFLGCSPDGMNGGRKIGMDAKNVRFKTDEWGEPGTDEVPKHLLWQAHHMLTVTGFKRWDIAALFSGCKLEIFQIDRDQELCDIIVDMAGSFWNNHVQPRIEPAFDGSEAAASYLLKKYPKGQEIVRMADADESQLMRELKAVLDNQKQLDELVNEIKNKIKDKIGSDKGIIDSIMGKVLWSNVRASKKFNSKVLKEKYPEIYEECKILGNEYRMFRPYWNER